MSYRNKGEAQLLDTESSRAAELAQEAEPDLRREIETKFDDEAIRTTRVLFVDPAAAEALYRHHPHRMPATCLQVWELEKTLPADTLHLLKRATEPVAWFSPQGANGSRLQDLVKRWIPDVEGAKPVRFIDAMAPGEWDGITPTFDELCRNASSKPPPQPPRRRPNSNRHRSGRPGATLAEKAEEADDYDTSSMRSAERLLIAHGEHLLVVHDSDAKTSDLRVVDQYGIWTDGTNILLGWLADIADHLVEKAHRDKVDQQDGRTWLHFVRGLRKLREPGSLEGIRKAAAAALYRLKGMGHKCAEVKDCNPAALDANLQFIGVANGVVDLIHGCLLSPEEGGEALVTMRTPIVFDPDAKHLAIDTLFAHMEPELREYAWRVLSYHMHGRPSRRIYTFVGASKGGKTTLTNAVVGTLGNEIYADVPLDAATVKGAGKGSTPEWEAFTSPRRWAIMDEIESSSLPSRVFKRLSGDTEHLSFRRLYKDKTTKPATAGILIVCNSGTVPYLNTREEAMADRIVELPYPQIPEDKRDPKFKEIVKTDDFRSAFLARLVAGAAKETPGEPPEPPESVKAATRARIEEDSGELGAFAKRLCPSPGDVLEFSDVWAAWCECCNENEDAKEPGGISKRRLTRLLRTVTPDLPMAQSFSVQGKNVRGWRGWRLLTVEEAEAQEQKGKAVPVNLELNAYFVGELTPEIVELLRTYPDAHGRPPDIAQRLQILLWAAAREATPEEVRKIRADMSRKEADRDGDRPDLFGNLNGDTAQVAPMRDGETELY